VWQRKEIQIVLPLRSSTKELTMNDNPLRINLGVYAFCGEPESVWCEGHVDSTTFIKEVERMSAVTGVAMIVPKHTTIYRAYLKSHRKEEDSDWEVFDQRMQPFPGSRPITFVYFDELDEKDDDPPSPVSHLQNK
jgi:hypothetical protein